MSLYVMVQASARFATEGVVQGILYCLSGTHVLAHIASYCVKQFIYNSFSWRPNPGIVCV